MVTRLTGATLAIALLACAAPDVSLERGEPDPAGYRVSVPGDLIGRFPADPYDMVGGALLEGAFGLALASEGGVFVLDVMGRNVLHLAGDAALLAEMGRPGEGPGEFQAPISIRADPAGGVWVADPQQQRLVRFSADGSTSEDLRAPHAVINFAVFPSGDLVYPTMSANTLLAAQTPGAEARELAIDPGLVPAEISTGPMDRLSQGALGLVVLTPDTLVLFQNRHSTDFRAWRVAIDLATDRVTEVRRLPLPGWLYTMIEEETQRFRQEVSDEWATGDFFVPFKSVRVTDGALWLAPAPSGRVVALSLPHDPSDSASVVLPKGEVTDGLVDAAVIDDRLVALYSTEVRVYALERVASERFAERE